MILNEQRPKNTQSLALESRNLLCNYYCGIYARTAMLNL